MLSFYVWYSDAVLGHRWYSDITAIRQIKWPCFCQKGVKGFGPKAFKVNRIGEHNREWRKGFWANHLANAVSGVVGGPRVYDTSRLFRTRRIEQLEMGIKLEPYGFRELVLHLKNAINPTGIGLGKCVGTLDMRSPDRIKRLLIGGVYRVNLVASVWAGAARQHCQQNTDTAGR